jgi:holo-[acyl-carrier protein] synthase
VHIVGIGVDICDIDRFARVLERTPRIRERIFTDRERLGKESAQSLAARFAVKEAVAKVLRSTMGLRWRECEVVMDGQGAPLIEVSGAVAERAHTLGIDRWHVSISHDGGMSIAFVVAEGTDAGRLSRR